MKVKLVTGKPWTHICLMTLALQARIQYANIDSEINQSEHGSFLTAGQSWFNSLNSGGEVKPRLNRDYLLVKQNFCVNPSLMF